MVYKKNLDPVEKKAPGPAARRHGRRMGGGWLRRLAGATRHESLYASSRRTPGVAWRSAAPSAQGASRPGPTSGAAHEQPAGPAV